jgi:hypothetical protein
MTASDSDFWLLVQRLFAFEEPVSTAAQVRKLLGRQLKSSAAKDIDSQSEEELVKTFNSYFGTANAFNLTNATISAFVALENVGRMSDLSFAHWMALRARNNFKSLIATTGIKHDAASEALYDWISTLGLTGDSAQWVHFNAKCVPDWRRLKHSAVWSGDARADFIAFMVEKLDARGPSPRLTPKDFFHLQREFKESLKSWREQLPGSFLPNGIILVEGPTEVILLPHFALCMGVNFDKLAALVMPAGGANQVVRRYLHLKEAVTLPIICLLDGDSPEHALTLDENLREIDRLFVLSVKEIEDAFDLPVFVDLVNNYLQSLLEPTNPITVSEMNVNRNRTEVVGHLLNQRGLPPFNKLAFAKTVTKSMRTSDQVPTQLRHVVRAVHHALAQR